MGDVQSSSVLLRAEDSHIGVHCEIARKSIRPVASACMFTAETLASGRSVPRKQDISASKYYSNVAGYRDVDTSKLYTSFSARKP
jgi:hypothetical protein